MAILNNHNLFSSHSKRALTDKREPITMETTLATSTPMASTITVTNLLVQFAVHLIAIVSVRVELFTH